MRPVDGRGDWDIPLDDHVHLEPCDQSKNDALSRDYDEALIQPSLEFRNRKSVPLVRPPEDVLEDIPLDEEEQVKKSELPRDQAGQALSGQRPFWPSMADTHGVDNVGDEPEDLSPLMADGKDAPTDSGAMYPSDSWLLSIERDDGGDELSLQAENDGRDGTQGDVTSDDPPGLVGSAGRPPSREIREFVTTAETAVLDSVGDGSRSSRDVFAGEPEDPLTSIPEGMDLPAESAVEELSDEVRARLLCDVATAVHEEDIKDALGDDEGTTPDDEGLTAPKKSPQTNERRWEEPEPPSLVAMYLDRSRESRRTLNAMLGSGAVKIERMGVHHQDWQEVCASAKKILGAILDTAEEQTARKITEKLNSIALPEPPAGLGMFSELVGLLDALENDSIGPYAVRTAIMLTAHTFGVPPLFADTLANITKVLMRGLHGSTRRAVDAVTLAEILLYAEKNDLGQCPGLFYFVHDKETTQIKNLFNKLASQPT